MTFPFEYDVEKGEYRPNWITVEEEEPEPEPETFVDNSQFWTEEGDDE